MIIMATYEYVGLSFYVNMDEKTQDKINILRGFITPFLNEGEAPMDDMIIEASEEMVQVSYLYDGYNRLSEDVKKVINAVNEKVNGNGGYEYTQALFAADCYFPENTPKDKERATIKEVDEKLYLYIPLTAARVIGEMVAYVKSVVTTIFEGDIIQASELRLTEYDDYDPSLSKVFIRK